MKNKMEDPIKRPKAGDGTQDTNRKDRANWFGKSLEVSPEFLNEIDPPSSADNVPSRVPTGPKSGAEPPVGKQSEAKPSM